MHELGVLCQVVKTVGQAAEERKIQKIRYVALEVGEESGYLPYFLEKLFPVAAQSCPQMAAAELRLQMVPGRRLQIREFGYE